jgi:hypothetical protein
MTSGSRGIEGALSPPANQPLSRRTLGGAGGFASASRVAFAEARANGVFDVGLESGAGTPR